MFPRANFLEGVLLLVVWACQGKYNCFFNPLTAEWALRALRDFTLSNARRFYSSMGNPLDGKGLTTSKTMSPLNDIILGLLNRTDIINYLIILGKLYIWECRKAGIFPDFNIFLKKSKNYIWHRKIYSKQKWDGCKCQKKMEINFCL